MKVVAFILIVVSSPHPSKSVSQQEYSSLEKCQRAAEIVEKLHRGHVVTECVEK